MSKLWLALLSLQPKATPSYLSYTYTREWFFPTVSKKQPLVPLAKHGEIYRKHWVYTDENDGAIGSFWVLCLQLQIGRGITASLNAAVHPFVFYFSLAYSLLSYFLCFCCCFFLLLVPKWQNTLPTHLPCRMNSCVGKKKRFFLSFSLSKTAIPKKWK